MYHIFLGYLYVSFKWTKWVIEQMFSDHKKQREKKDTINKKITKSNLHKYFMYTIVFCSLTDKQTNNISKIYIFSKIRRIFTKKNHSSILNSNQVIYVSIFVHVCLTQPDQLIDGQNIHIHNRCLLIRHFTKKNQSSILNNGQFTLQYSYIYALCILTQTKYL